MTVLIPLYDSSRRTGNITTSSKKRYSTRQGVGTPAESESELESKPRTDTRAEVLRRKFQELERKLEDMAIGAFRNVRIVQYSQLLRET